MEIEDIRISIDRIKNILLINTDFVNNFGLNGKLGAAIFFFHLSRIENRKKNLKYGNHFLDSIANMPNDIEMNFIDGLSGVGYGIDLLNRFEFIDIEINSILQDADVKIYNYIINCPVEDIISTLSGAKYILKRVTHVNNNEESYFLFAELLIKISDKIEQFLEFNKTKWEVLNDNNLALSVQIFDILRGMNKVGINLIQNNRILDNLREQLAHLAKLKFQPIDIYSIGLYVKVISQFGINTFKKELEINGQKSDHFNFYRELRFYFAYLEFKDNEQESLFKYINVSQVPTLKQLSSHALDVLVNEFGSIPLGIWGLSGLGISLINVLAEEQSITEVFKISTFCS